ncbi:MAG TPA: lipoyl(octanoyl) transferase LipB [bacterium]
MPGRPAVRTAWVVECGTMPYGQAWALQRALVAARQAERIEDTLLLVEHPPVITIGRAGRTANILAPRDLLAARGFEVYETERGGDVTYHGPGQLVGYPIVDLRALDEDVVRYVRLLEATLIDALGAFGIVAGRVRGHTGVWVGEAKIAAIGVAVKRKVTMHGFALNVAPDLDHFTVINACGLGKPVTSMTRLLERPVPVGEVQPVVARAFGAAFSMAPAPIALETVQAMAGEVALPGSGESPRAVAHRGESFPGGVR